jgi:hypothetical protein
VWNFHRSGSALHPSRSKDVFRTARNGCFVDSIEVRFPVDQTISFGARKKFRLFVVPVDTTCSQTAPSTCYVTVELESNAQISSAPGCSSFSSQSSRSPKPRSIGPRLEHHAQRHLNLPQAANRLHDLPEACGQK